MNLTRRKLVSLLPPSLAATRAVTIAAAQSAGARPQASAALDAARARMKQTSDVLAQQAVPMTVEPAFQFKA